MRNHAKVEQNKSKYSTFDIDKTDESTIFKSLRRTTKQLLKDGQFYSHANVNTRDTWP